MSTRSAPSAAFGVTANTDLCAVQDCTNTPRPQVCPYDESSHRHGAIHYDCGYPVHKSLVFRKGDWYWMCDVHYEIVCRERREFTAAQHNKLAR